MSLISPDPAGPINIDVWETFMEFLAQEVVVRHLMSVDRAFFPLFEKPSAAPVRP